MSRENQSILTGYEIQVNLDGMAFDEVWDELIATPSAGVSCREVLHFDFAPMDLSKMLRKGDLREVLDEMRSSGVNFVFVGPAVGKPIDGLFL